MRADCVLPSQDLPESNVIGKLLCVLLSAGLMSIANNACPASASVFFKWYNDYNFNGISMYDRWDGGGWFSLSYSNSPFVPKYSLFGLSDLSEFKLSYQLQSAYPIGNVTSLATYTLNGLKAFSFSNGENSKQLSFQTDFRVPDVRIGPGSTNPLALYSTTDATNGNGIVGGYGFQYDSTTEIWNPPFGPVQVMTSYDWAKQIEAKANAISNSDAAGLNRNFYRIAILTRENAYFGSSQDPTIKSIEYFGRGYQGGSLLSHLSDFGVDGDGKNDFMNLIGPISVRGYNLFKSFNLVPGEGLPISAVGGSEDVDAGYRAARSGMTLDAAIEMYFNGAAHQDMPPRLPDIPNTSPEMPATPINNSPLTFLSSSTNVFAFHVADVGQRIWIDPPTNLSAIFSVSDNSFATVIFSAAASVATSFHIDLDGIDYLVSPGQIFDFRQHGFLDGIDAFRVSGFAGPVSFESFSAGFTFVDTADTYVFETLVSTSPVPELPAYTMLLIGFAALSIYLSRQSSRSPVRWKSQH